MKNKRPLFTPDDIETFKFMLISMRDDRAQPRACIDPEWLAKWDRAEALAKRILGKNYPPNR